LAYSSHLKIQAIYSSETSVDFHWTAQQYAYCVLNPGFLLGILFEHEEGGDMFFQNFS
jgi:hypothetical protein